MIDAAFASLVQAVLAAVAVLLGTLITIYVPRAIAAFEQMSGAALTAQQQETVMTAARTGAGILETMLDQGAVKLEHIKPDNPAVRAQAAAAIARVPTAAAALNKSIPSMAETIVGLVDTSPKPPVVALAATPSAPPSPLLPRMPA